MAHIYIYIDRIFDIHIHRHMDKIFDANKHTQSIYKYILLQWYSRCK